MERQKALMLMSHGDFAEAAIKSAELIVGKQENYAYLGVHVEDSLEDLRREMAEKLSGLDTAEGLIVLTDILGGTPSNLAMSLLEGKNVLVCTGLNLPMLIELSTCRDRPVSELKELIREAYGDGLTMLDSESFGKEVNNDDLVL